MVFDLLTACCWRSASPCSWRFARVALPHDAVLTRAEGLDGWVDSDRYQRGTSLPGLLVFRFDAPLFFANSARFRERLEVVLERNPGEEEWVLLDFEGVGAVDATAIEMLAELIKSLREKNIVVAIARANDRALTPLQRAGLVSDGALRVFETINRAVREFEASRTSDGSTGDVSAGKSAEPRVTLDGNELIAVATSDEVLGR
jgi:SulP family sulfate permease